MFCTGYATLDIHIHCFITYTAPLVIQTIIIYCFLVSFPQIIVYLQI